MREQGNISITAENMFPIIRKWLYADRDIFIREQISNASDAISKLARLQSLGEAPGMPEGEEFRITVELDEDAKTVVFEDNGIGMTAEEVKKYINQVAFSGAKDFFEQYKDAGADTAIIGHFGLGFYSAFMVAGKVMIDTLSFREGSEPVRWTSETGTEFVLEPGERSARGTRITLALDDENQDFAEYYKVREVLLKYFRYLPTKIFLRKAGEEVKADEQPVNAAEPLWNKTAKDCTEEEYRSFYRELFPMAPDPLFWVHLSIDYPFRLKGILYFPRLRNEFETIEGQVKLYCNQVFIADNLKEVIPEYLLLLRGGIDCPDLPLNVSRSMLQNDGTVSKISAHITRKVADRLTGMFRDEREAYEKYWDDVSPFIKYGCLRDEKFYERLKSALIFKKLDGSYQTVEEYLDSLTPEPANPSDSLHDDCDCGHDHGDGACDCAHDDNESSGDAEKKPEPPAGDRIVYYASDPRQQAQYISMFEKNGLSAVILEHPLDNHFITLLERKLERLRFRRIDADLSGLTGGEGAALDAEGLKELFRTLAPDTELKIESLREGAAPAVLVLSEEGRRMQEMARMFGQKDFAFPAQLSLVLNSSHPLLVSLDALRAQGRTEDAALLAAQVYDLARLAQEPLPAEQLTAFIERSARIMALAAK